MDKDRLAQIARLVDMAYAQAGKARQLAIAEGLPDGPYADATTALAGAVSATARAKREARTADAKA